MSAKPRILYISSASFESGPGVIGKGHVSQLKNAGYDVDALTLYRGPSCPDVMYVKEHSSFDTFINKFKRFFLNKRLPGAPHYFFYKKETQPPVPVSKVLKRIKKDYDLVIIYFWQELLSFETVEAIYDKLNHPVVFFFSPDYSHMTGGCHFTCDCQRYQTGCGRCPAFHSNDDNDFTHWNVVFRRRFYEKVKPVVFGNSYMSSFYKQSYLLKDARVEVYPPFFDVQRFKPVDKEIARERLEILPSDSFCIAFGCQELSNPRKGIDYLIKALDLLCSRLSDDEKTQVLLLVAGKDYDKVKHKLPFSSIGFGYLPIDRLSDFYSAADVFLCSSVDDAGPSMVSQSITCGTPVVGFKMGAMLDNVLERGTGYCAELRNAEDLSQGVEQFYRMSSTDYNRVSKHCIDFAINNSIPEKRVQSWMDIFEKYK